MRNNRLCYLLLLILPLSGYFTLRANTGKPTGRYSFGNLLLPVCTPGADNGTTWFADCGSWTGYTLPQSRRWINGFCGPFEFNSRRWLSRAIATVMFGKDGSPETFVPDSTACFPGELYLSAASPSGTIRQRLRILDSHTALLECETDGIYPLVFTNEGLSACTRIDIDGPQCLIALNKEESLILRFEENTTINKKDNGYRAVTPGKEKIYLTLSYCWNENDRLKETEEAARIMSDPESRIRRHDERWEHYLANVLRPDMPYLYDRVAVKAVMTLLSNRRAARGGLLHEGVIPSHSVDYFTGFWAWDSWKHAVALSLFEPELAKNQIKAMFDYQTPEGMIVDCIYTDPAENNARNSKPPLAAWAVQAVWEATADTAFVREIFPALLKYHRWWYAYRDHDRNGYCEYGSADGTTVAAAWESGMDNAVRFDRTGMLDNGKGGWSFDQESVDLNAFLAVEYTLLKQLAKACSISFEDTVRTYDPAAYFFDSSAGYFFDRRLSDKSFVTCEGSEGYVPLWGGLATPEQAQQTLRLFTDPDKMGTYVPFPTLAADNPDFTPNGYWRGPVWLDQTYFGIHGLRRYGYTELADEYTKNTFDRLNGLTGDAPIHENYDTHTGARLKSANFSWSAAHLLLLYRECGALNDRQEDLCRFESDYRNFAYISRVEIGTTDHLIPYRVTSYTDYFSLFTAILTPGEKASLKITATNRDSGKNDRYKLRVWIDWNGDYRLTPDELIETKTIDPIGAPGENHRLEFSIFAPAQAVKDRKLKMRIFLHYTENETDGADPCGWVDSGQAYDYGVIVRSDAPVKPAGPDSETTVFTDKTAGCIRIESPYPIVNIGLFSIDGKLVSRTTGLKRQLDIRQLSKGIYLLKIKTVNFPSGAGVSVYKIRID